MPFALSAACLIPRANASQATIVGLIAGLLISHLSAQPPPSGAGASLSLGFNSNPNPNSNANSTSQRRSESITIERFHRLLSTLVLFNLPAQTSGADLTDANNFASHCLVLHCVALAPQPQQPLRQKWHRLRKQRRPQPAKKARSNAGLPAPISGRVTTLCCVVGLAGRPARQPASRRNPLANHRKLRHYLHSELKAWLAAG